MPQLLTRSTVRLLEACADNLSLAMTAAAMPVRHTFKSSEASFAGVVGLAGVAAEQAISAVLIQIDGDDAAFADASRYKTAGQVLAEVRQALTAPPVARAAFLTSGVSDPDGHRKALHEALTPFTLLISQRAAALHGGQGVSREVALAAIRTVHGFLRLLKQSQRISAYLKSMPDIPERPTEPTLILDELVNRISSATTSTQKGFLLRQLFLVLPEVPPHQPDWLAAFDRIAVLPQEGDINLLMMTLQHAQPARFARLSGAGQALPVTVTKAPGALPIEIQALRSNFTRLHDQIGGDFANANGRLAQGILHVPPETIMVVLFAMDPRAVAEAFGDGQLTAHKAWSFVVTALSPTTGTPRPYWFLVRRVAELGQLRALLTQAANIARPQVARRIREEALEGIESLDRGTQLPARHSLTTFCQSWLTAANDHSEKLEEAVERSQRFPSKALTDAAGDAVKAVAIGLGSIAEAWTAIEDAGIVSESQTDVLSARLYWARKLAEAATEPNDVKFLATVALDRTLTGAHTAARRSHRGIDATRFGPSMALPGLTQA